MLKRIYLVMIMAIIVAILSTGLFAFQTMSSFNDQTNQHYLISAGNMIRLSIQQGKTMQAAVDDAVQVFENEKEPLRVTIVDNKGKAILDSDVNAEEMDNHLFRPEIAYAFNHDDPGMAIRQSQTLKISMMYVAIHEPTRDLVIRVSMPLYTYRTGLVNMVTTFVIALAVILIILLAFGLFLVRHISRPLIGLRTAAVAMSDGNYDSRVRDLRTTESEVTDLSKAFNTMADNLQNNMQILEDRSARLDAILDSMADPLLAVGKNKGVTFMNSHARDVFGRNLNEHHTNYPLILLTHSQETEDLVDQAISAGHAVSCELALPLVRGNIVYQVIASPIRSSLSDGAILTFHDISQGRQMQKMRSDFVANVTHELRTPLTSIRGFIETLRNGAINNPTATQRFLDIIDIEAERLHQLINDILALSEIEDMRSDMDVEKFDLNALIDDVAVLLDETASERQVALIVETGDEPLMVHANRYRIKQILINLTDNAIKYNRPGGKVYLNAWRQADSRIHMIVRDTGVGIPQEHQERIFERFYRVDRSRSRELGGTGLGLSIVKHIAQLYDGNASVESKPDEGSTFHVIMAI